MAAARRTSINQSITPARPCQPTRRPWQPSLKRTGPSGAMCCLTAAHVRLRTPGELAASMSADASQVLHVGGDRAASVSSSPSHSDDQRRRTCFHRVTDAPQSRRSAGNRVYAHQIIAVNRGCRAYAPNTVPESVAIFSDDFTRRASHGVAAQHWDWRRRRSRCA